MRMLGFWIFVALIHFSDSKLTQHHVTCGSVLKLLNTRHEVRLHSHEVNYGSGSGQQSVTAVGDKTDSNSYWQVLERNNSPQCNRGRLIKCGQRIRLMHLVTRKNLHSHHFKSPLSDNFEVSAFGTNGAGDEGDDWQVECSGTYWERGSEVRLKHISTSGYLYVSGKRYNRPISGQYEVSVSSLTDSATKWIATEGIYVHPLDSPNSGLHDEL